MQRGARVPLAQGWSAADGDRLLLLKSESVRADIELSRAKSRVAAFRELTDREERRREDQLGSSTATAGGGGATGARPPLPCPSSRVAAEEGARALFGLPASEVLWRTQQLEVVTAGSVPGAHLLVTAPTGWGKNSIPGLTAFACCRQTLVFVIAPYRTVAQQMLSDYSNPALGAAFVHSLVSTGDATHAAEDAELTESQAAELLAADLPQRGTTGHGLLPAVAGGCRVVILTAEGLSANSRSGVSIRVAMGAIMSGLEDEAGPNFVTVVVDEYHNATGFREDTAGLNACLRGIRGRAVLPVDPRRLGMVAMSAYVFPADCARLHANIGLRGDAQHFVLPLDRGANHLYVVREQGLTDSLATIALSLLEEGSMLAQRPDLGIGMGPVDPETGRRTRKPEDERGLVFVPTRALTNVVCNLINKHAMLPLLHGEALAYHSGLTESEKHAVLAAWRCGYTLDADGNRITVYFLVATSGLIEGFDEPNVVFVVVPLPHGDMKTTAQAFGRSARAPRGMIRAICMLGWSIGGFSPYAQYAVGDADERARAIAGALDAMDFCTEPGCRRRALLIRFGEKLVGKCQGCDQCRSLFPALAAQPGPGGPLDVTDATVGLFETFEPGVPRTLGKLKKNVRGWCRGSWDVRHDDWVANKVLTRALVAGHVLLDAVANPLGAPFWHLTVAGDGGRPSHPDVIAILAGSRAVVISQRCTT